MRVQGIFRHAYKVKYHENTAAMEQRNLKNGTVCILCSAEQGEPAQSA